MNYTSLSTEQVIAEHRRTTSVSADCMPSSRNKVFALDDELRHRADNGDKKADDYIDSYGG